MDKEEFPKIQRGNGVLNDNLATLGDIMNANLQKIKSLETKIDGVKQEIVGVNEAVGGVKKTIKDIDQESVPREKKSFWLLIASVAIGAVSLIIAYLAFRK